ncbi:MAG TPA: DUF4140 domain-containing protein [Verrucomicrobiae bacterium]|nr:DUF4140 domain-containing protein [Verrucomicrobiae bacterium]
MRCLVPFLLACLPAAALAGQKDVLLYLDGAVVTEVVPVVRGEAEIVLPPGADAASLRIRPSGCSILRVTTAPSPAAAKGKREIARLEEHKAALQDRLRALEVREEIFRGAAKSQSAKAPRKTKTNPDPLETVRKGTDFAITQLESVYRLHRRTEAELKGVEESLRLLRASSSPLVARVKVSGGGSVSASYLRPDLSWKPFYDLRVEGGEVTVAQHAVLPKLEGARGAVLGTKLQEGGGIPVRVSGDFPLVRTERVSLKSALPPSSPAAPASLAFPQPGGGLPPGDASCFRSGEFIGHGSLAAPTVEGVLEVRCGG